MLCDQQLPSENAKGPDGISNEVLSIVARAKPLTKVYNTCIRQSSFPVAWKEARLVLIHKGPGKPFENPSSFRPLRLFNTTVKTLEWLILARLNSSLATAENLLSPLLFGFRTGRSTEDAISSMLEVAKKAATRAEQNRDLCVMVRETRSTLHRGT